MAEPDHFMLGPDGLSGGRARLRRHRSSPNMELLQSRLG